MEWQFSCYGTNFEIRCLCPTLCAEVPHWLPPVRDATFGPIQHVVCLRPAPGGWELLVDGSSQAVVGDSHPALAGLEYLIRVLMSQHGASHAFVHAGVVSLAGRAWLIPGHSFSGKTSLVRAFLAAGAAYYSDECAVLDQDGRVWPYPRLLNIRGEGAHPTRVSAQELGAPVGTGPAAVAGILLCRYRRGAHWLPRRLTPGEAALHLVHHSLSFHHPQPRLKILGQVADRAVTLEGERGEGSVTVERVLGEDLREQIRSTGDEQLPQNPPRPDR